MRPETTDVTPAATTRVPGAAAHVEAIHIASVEGAPMRSLERVRAIAGVGLEGDRYAARVGRYSGNNSVSRDITLIEAEVIDDLAAGGIELRPGDTRRNITTRGIGLNELVGRRFRIGAVECRGTALCEPCAYLQGLLGKPVLAALVHRGGLRADILTEGELSVGDAIVPIDPIDG